MTVELALSGFGLAAWLYLLLARGGFWRADIRDEVGVPHAPAEWPSVIAVVPARNEADVIAKSLSSLLNQDYANPLKVILVDDQSDDGTADAARTAAEAAGASDRLTILRGKPLPQGWTGKLWAMKQGVAQASSLAEPPRYLLLTDADIAYEPGVIRRLVARAEAGSLVLTSLMVKLRCESLAERALIPAFVFFFQMLYPFAWTNRRDSTMAAAAGGCMLVRRDALEAAGGIEAIRSSLIDDCALGRSMKKQGAIWLGLTDSVHSLRPYPGLGRHPAHGFAIGLRPAQLLALAAGRHRRRDADYLSAAAALRDLWQWRCAGDGRCNLGPDGIRFLADRTVLPALAAMGCGASCHRGSLYGIHAQFGIAALAWQGRALERARAGAPRGGIMTTGPVWEAGEKSASRRKFPRRVAPRLKTVPSADFGLLPICSRRRRCRRPSGAIRKREDPQAGPVRGDPSRENRRH